MLDQKRTPFHSSHLDVTRFSNGNTPVQTLDENSMYSVYNDPTWTYLLAWCVQLHRFDECCFGYWYSLQ
jgi:hypothetical protein